jgi:hypothetical protein
MVLHCNEHALFIAFYCTIRNLKLEQHVMFIFCMKLANNPIETYGMLGTAYGDKALSWAQTFWFIHFQEGGGVWKMTLVMDDLKQYQTQNWWRKCAVYLQKTAT